MEQSANERIQQQLQFSMEADKLKNVLRQTLLCDSSRRETDAEHSWHLALLCILLYEHADPAVDLLRVLKMAVVHDMVEIYAGDTFAFDDKGVETQAAREAAAADRLFAMLPSDQGSELRALWEEFDARETKDALYAAAIDTLQPLMNNVATGGHTWKLGNVHSDKVYRRIEPLKAAMPQVWAFADRMIRDCMAKGWLKE